MFEIFLDNRNLGKSASFLSRLVRWPNSHRSAIERAGSARGEVIWGSGRITSVGEGVAMSMEVVQATKNYRVNP